MKYVVLGLILLLVWLARVPTRPPANLPAAAAASFRSTSAGVTNTVVIDLKDSADGARIALAVHQDARTCAPAGPCHDRLLLSGFTVQDAGPRDARTDRLRGRAFVHATIRVHDDITQTELPVRVDAIWRDAGPQVCGPQMTTGLNPTIECVRTTSVLADVAIGSTPLITNQTVPDGRLAWHVRST